MNDYKDKLIDFYDDNQQKSNSQGQEDSSYSYIDEDDLNKSSELEALKTLFQRESQGVFKFGNERVIIKIDERNNNQILIEYKN